MDFSILPLEMRADYPISTSRAGRDSDESPGIDEYPGRISLDEITTSIIRTREGYREISRQGIFIRPALDPVSVINNVLRDPGVRWPCITLHFRRGFGYHHCGPLSECRRYSAASRMANVCDRARLLADQCATFDGSVSARIKNVTLPLTKPSKNLARKRNVAIERDRRNITRYLRW
jgi:hypothetical protein